VSTNDPRELPSIAATAFRDRRFPLLRSFRMHRPRAGFCHARWCQQCRVTLADGRVVLACRTPDDGQARALRPRGIARLAGRLAAHLPPWFYEDRFLRPVFLRQFYLERLRRMSGAPHPPPAQSPTSPRADYRELECDCLVVGGGLSGLVAARTLAAAGRSVVLVEAERCGGRARWRTDAQSRVTDAITGARNGGTDLYEGVTCVGLYANPSRALCVSDRGSLVIRYKALVAATGAYDRLPAFPGNDLPGVIGVRAFERLVAQRMIPAAATIGVWGSAEGVAAAAASAAATELRIDFVAGAGVTSGATSCFRDARVAAAHGGQRLRTVTLDGHGRVRCDVLVVAFSQPAYELPAQLGLAPALGGDPPTLRFEGIAHEQLLCVGALAGHDELREAKVAAAVAAWLANPATVPAGPTVVATMSSALPDDALVCLCEDVRAGDVRAALADGYRDVELLKRHTGAGTGPCQGKLCHAEILRCLYTAGQDARLPTARPFARPVPLSRFAGKP